MFVALFESPLKCLGTLLVYFYTSQLLLPLFPLLYKTYDLFITFLLSVFEDIIIFDLNKEVVVVKDFTVCLIILAGLL